MALFGNDQPTPTANGMTLDEAHQIISAARTKAEEIKVPMNIAVVDTGNNLTAFARMDGAWLGSIDIAISKAKTARYFDMTSADLGAASQAGQPLFGINTSNDGTIIVFGGGIPLVRGGIIVGAVGVSGGAVPQDIEVAEAGAESFNNPE